MNGLLVCAAAHQPHGAVRAPTGLPAALPTTHPQPTAHSAEPPVYSPTAHAYIPATHNYIPTTHPYIPTTYMYSPTTHTYIPTTHTYGLSSHTAQTTVHVACPTAHTYSPTTHTTRTTTYTYSPATHTSSSTNHTPQTTVLPSSTTVQIYAPTTHTYSTTPQSSSPTTHTYSPTTHKTSPTTYTLQTTVQTSDPAIHTYSPTTHTDSPTTYTYNLTVHSYNPTTPTYTPIPYSGTAPIQTSNHGADTPNSTAHTPPTAHTPTPTAHPPTTHTPILAAHTTPARTTGAHIPIPTTHASTAHTPTSHIPTSHTTTTPTNTQPPTAPTPAPVPTDHTCVIPTTCGGGMCLHRLQPGALNKAGGQGEKEETRLCYCRRISSFVPCICHGAHFKVFLGGSCNPTTWRHDEAIPFFKDHSITYFNPQVANWHKEFMELEDRAKQTAEILFFVIDKQTRSTASMVEAAYLAGCGRKLILVIKDLDGPGTMIAGEPISVIEYEDLSRSHAVLTDIVERQGYPVFDNIDNALRCTRKVIHNNMKVSDLTIADGAQPVKYAHARVADTIIRLKDAFNQVDHTKSGRLSYSDANLAYKTLTDQSLPDIPELHNSSFTFEQFCSLYTECKYRRKTWWQKLLEGLLRISSILLDWCRGTSGGKHTEDPTVRQWDIFLGGTCGRTTWRESIVIPALRKYGITAYNPQFTDWNTHYLPLEANRKSRCRLLLYVITGDTRGITSMLEASHHIGQGCDVVLCIQHLQNGVVLDNEMLTPTAVKDYNRARTYLADLANRDGIPIFDSIEEATASIIKKLLRSEPK